MSDELLLNILHYVPKTQLYDLCLIPAFHGAATELLYGSCERKSELHCSPLRTIITCPTLAVLVEEVIAGCNHISQPYNNEDMRVFIAGLRDMGMATPEKIEWSSQIQQEDQRAELALLLCHTPNIRRLVVGNQLEAPPSLCMDVPRPPLWLQLLNRATQEPRPAWMPSFHKLQSIVISLLAGMTSATIFSLLGLPGLRKLRLINAGGSGIEFGSSHLYHAPLLSLRSSVSELELEDGYFDASFISDLIISCGALRHFSYSTDDWRSVSHLHGSKIGDAIRRHQKTLETFTLVSTSDIWPRHGNSTLEHCEPLGSLQAFERLAHISCESDMLLGVTNRLRLQDVLPGSIQTVALELPDCTHVSGGQRSFCHGNWWTEAITWILVAVQEK
ncbi:hypothetical protein K432DRAFT_447579 [Lepidopterella palustris CBS 459.81]|uniref:Uncharacterized protein n=1 Tax=Lepidopterella palustris CBS 459.81 TaxID=1314670 RepID=A0A8E2J953_9PEZI|nr:hypothetical protein K432DRAFT_447579 [Lepidopterella palustris CBS 459.81]